MSLLVSLIKNLVGSVIVLFDLVTRPRKAKRQADKQRQVEEEISGMALYQHFACPFCIKTRRALHKLNLPIQKRAVPKGSDARQELASNGGKVQVPCLRITENGQDTWMYESSEIIRYLEQRFA